MKQDRKRGFTLAELLIVIAIIGILVAISIPVFSGQVKRARIAVDDSNVRSAYSILQMAQLTHQVVMEDGSVMELAPQSGNQGSVRYELFLTPTGRLDLNKSTGTFYRLQEDHPDCPLEKLFPDFHHEKGKRICIEVAVGYGITEEAWKFYTTD